MKALRFFKVSYDYRQEDGGLRHTEYLHLGETAARVKATYQGHTNLEKLRVVPVETPKKRQEELDAINQLRQWIKPGDTLHTVLRNVSYSGMTRHIDVYRQDKDGLQWLSGYARHILGYRLAKHDSGLVVGGCGMDMGFHVVYNLSRSLFPTGFALPKSEYPRNGQCSKCRESHTVRRNGTGYVCEKCQNRKFFDTDGGYALKQRWI